MNRSFSLYALLGLVMALGFASCNDKNSDSTDDYGNYSASSTLISGFSLQANSKVLNNLDSVHFVVDPVRHVIYNPDSLPVGTNVTKLTVSVTFPHTVKNASFTVTGGKAQSDTTFDYSSSTTDSIDFSGNVQLTVNSYDMTHTRIYRVQVLVHKTEPDSMYWSQSLRRDLPGSTSATTDSRVVRLGSKWLCLLNNGGSYTLSSADAPNQKQWEQRTVSFGFTPQLRSLTATESDLYILSTTGELYRSTDQGATWLATGQSWHSIKGGYQNRVLGVRTEGGTYYYDEYPRPAGYAPSEADSDFPIDGSSSMVEADNEWTENQQSMLVGGVKADGTLSNSVWGYDGTTWARISNDINWRHLPALKDASLIRYYTCTVSKVNFKVTRYETWMVMGGTLADGSVNRNVYSSKDQGILWVKADSLYQLPAYVPSFTGAQVFVNNETLSTTTAAYAASSNGGITTLPTTWECPYIYLFGGRSSNGALLNSVWKAHIGRLAMRPVY